MHLHRDLGISQKSAWFMAHRIRKVWEDQQDGSNRYDGPVEFNEAFFGGREKNKHWDKRLRANWHRGKADSGGREGSCERRDQREGGTGQHRPGSAGIRECPGRS